VFLILIWSLELVAVTVSHMLGAVHVAGLR
jgi:hypothetical protein